MNRVGSNPPHRKPAETEARQDVHGFVSHEPSVYENFDTCRIPGEMVVWPW